MAMVGTSSLYLVFSSCLDWVSYASKYYSYTVAYGMRAMPLGFFSFANF